jgi:hypothetical protein
MPTAFILHPCVADAGAATSEGISAMNWNLIENKWAAMTRRIRSDWSADRLDDAGRAVRRSKGSDAMPGAIADAKTATANDPGLKSSAK